MKKISELNTKSFLGGTGAAANSYVLINYEDATTTEPVTYKASLQELGRAIANDQQLYKKTSGGAVTTNVNNNAYANTTAEKLVSSSEKAILEKMTYYTTSDCQPHLILEGASPNDTAEIITTARYTDTNHNAGCPVVYDEYDEEFKYIGDAKRLQPISLDFASTGYVADAAESAIMAQHTAKFDVQSSYLKYYSSAGILDNVTSRMISGAASTGDIDDAISNLKLQITDYSGEGAGDIGATLYELYNNNSNASTGYVDNAVSGLASTGYVDDAVANAGGGGGGFDPTESISCVGQFDPIASDSITVYAYPAMVYNGTVYRYNGANNFAALNYLRYFISGSDLILENERGETLCTLTGVISNN